MHKWFCFLNQGKYRKWRVQCQCFYWVVWCSFAWDQNSTMKNRTTVWMTSSRMLKPGTVCLLWIKSLYLFFLFNNWWRSCWKLSDSWICFSAAPLEEAIATNVEARAADACEDASDKCDKFAKYCGKNTYVNDRCKKTCGQPPCKSLYL